MCDALHTYRRNFCGRGRGPRTEDEAAAKVAALFNPTAARTPCQIKPINPKSVKLTSMPTAYCRPQLLAVQLLMVG